MSSRGTKPTPGQMAKIRAIPVNINTEKMERFIDLYALHPCTCAKFGKLVGLSKSRVADILRDKGVKAAIEKRREEIYDFAITSFKGLAEDSVDVMREKLKDDRDLRAAIEVLKGLGIAVPKMDIGEVKIELILPDSPTGKSITDLINDSD